MLRIRLIGGVAAEVGGTDVPPPSSRRAWGLLAWFAWNPGLHSRSTVAARLWPDVLDVSARQSLRSALWSLRQALPDGGTALVISRNRVGLHPDIPVDTRDFAELLAQGRLAEAVACGDGELLTGIDDDWALAARDEHRDRLVGALGALAEQSAAAADPVAAVRWARRAVALDPLSEDAARALMLRLDGAGDRPAALGVYQKLAERLRRELHIPPSEPTWRLAEELRSRSSEPTAGPQRRVSAGRPGVYPLSGRDAELAELHRAWTLARQGRGGLVVVHGEPGIGKTRLLNEFIELAADVGWVAGGGAPDLAGPALLPWTEICAAVVDRLGALPTGGWVSGLTPLLPGWVRGTAGRTPPVRSGPPGLEQARLSEAVVTLLHTAASVQPLVVVLEDAHATDRASLELLGYVSRRLTGRPLLVVVTFRDRPQRDELAALEQAQRQRGSLLADICLGPLDPGSVAGLARSVGVVADDAVCRVVDAAEGNALLAVESARALAGGRDLPAGLRAAVRAAQTRMPVASRHLVRVVAVAGRPVELAEAAQRAQVELSAALSPAEDEGLLTVSAGTVLFRHALLRDAVYADLDPVDRQELHAAAADLLIAGDALGRAAEAAAHLRASGRLAEAGRLLLQSAVRARGVGALADATELLQQAADALPDDPVPALELADVLAWRGRPEDAATAFDALLPLLEGAGDPAQLAAAHLRYAEWHYGPICRPRVAAEACRRGLAVLDGAGLREPAMRGALLSASAWCEALTGDPAEVDRTVARLEEVAAELPADPLLVCGAERARSFALLRQGRFAEAVAPGLRAADAANEAGRPDLVYAAMVNAAFGLAADGSLEEALSLLDRAAEALRNQGMLAIEVLLLVDRVWVLARLGRMPEAKEAAIQARRTVDRLGAPDLAAVVDAERGRLAARAGAFDEAARLLAAALSMPDASIGRPLARLQRAEALARSDRLDEAQDELRRVVLEPVGPGDWPDTLVARMAGVQGLLAAGRGESGLARRRLEESAAGWRRRLSRTDLAESMCAVLADLGRPIIGLLVPSEELSAVLADLAALDTATAAADPVARLVPAQP